MFKGRHFDQSVILLCVRRYLAYGLSLQNLEEMTVHLWVIRYSPILLERFNLRKRAVTAKWHVDETYIKVLGQWMYLYRAIDSLGDTVEFYFCEHRDLLAVKRLFKQALDRHSRPEAIVSRDVTNRIDTGADETTRLITIRKRKYLNNRIEQDHRRIKRRVRPMLGFKSLASASIILSGIELVHMIRKRQARFAYNPNPSLAEQFEMLAA